MHIISVICVILSLEFVLDFSLFLIYFRFIRVWAVVFNGGFIRVLCMTVLFIALAAYFMLISLIYSFRLGILEAWKRKRFG